MDVHQGQPICWEKNGNYTHRQRCSVHAMDGPSPIQVENKISKRTADCNSNEIGISDSQTDDQLGCTSECESLTNHNNTTQRKIKTSVSFNQSQGLTSVKQKDLSYDDLSRNIDANLAEIDMETFRSEDINSILALPAIYSGNYESVNNGEQCASVSGSLLNGLEIEASVSNRNSEDEISICKDEPLFSPQREPPVHERAISVDSLDSSSSYDQDLVLTCKANKNNYTIVFEGSETQFSEDSEYHSGGRSSEGESSRSEVFRINQTSAYTSNSMIQSDLVLTTWSNLKKSHISRRKSRFTEISIKSQSLPNLFNPSALVYDRKLTHLAKLRRIKNSHFFDFDSSHLGNAQIIRQCCYPYTLSLVKLFMKYKVSSGSSVCSSEHSSSSSSLVSHSVNNVNNLHTSSPKNVAKICDSKEKCNDLTNRNYNIKNISCENLNSSCKRPLFVDNAKVIEWRSPNCRENNNNEKLSAASSEINCNNRHTSCNNNNNNIVKETITISSSVANTATTPSGGECDNSQYFEDSLIEAPVLQTKNFHATPIKEEEETDISSGEDELMKTSGGSDNNNCDSAVDDVMIIQNNTLDVVSNVTRPENDHNLERINNIFPTSKSNLQPAVVTENERMNLNKAAQFVQNQLQDTQAKQCNGNFSVNAEASPMRSVSASARSSGRQISGIEHMLIRHSSSREASPNSSGYISSRHSSLERLQRSASSNAESPSRSTPLAATNIQLSKSRSCSTQIPVHVKDCCMQTSVNSLPTSNIKYLFVNSSGDIVTKDCSNEDISTRCVDKPDCKPKMLSKFSSTMHGSLSKDDKCIYVCFPNYSLPDLSFLNSVMSESSGSVFLSPTKFDPPQEMIRTLPSDPAKEDMEAGCRRRLLNIKDLDSLKVLLPDNLKHLLNHIESEKDESVTTINSESVQNIADSSRAIPDLLKTKELTKNADAAKTTTTKQSPSGILRKCSVVQSRKKEISPTSSCCQMHKACPVPKSPTRVNIQTCRPCGGCQHSPPVSIDPAYSSAAGHGIHIPVYDPVKSCSGCSICNAACATGAKCKETATSNFLQMSKDSGECRNGAMPIRNVMNPGNLSNDFCLDGAAACFPTKACHQPIPSSAMQHRHEDFNGSYRCENNLCCSSRKNSSSQPGTHHCHESSKEDKISNLPFKDPCTKVQGLPNNFQGCGELLDSDGAPQEFLVSPAQNSPCCAAPPDLYMLQSSVAEDSNFFHSSLRKKTGLVENLQKATAAIYDDYLKNKCSASCCTSFSVGQKILTSLCPAVHTILSDGLLPSVQGFFGPLPNSPWKVAEASIQLENSKKGVQEMLEQVNSEKLLTDSTYRFNAFIIGLMNLGCLEWWLGHLLSSRSLISHHYHPTALLSLLSLPASAHLQQELKELVSPLTNLSFSLDLAFETRMSASKGSSHGKCAVNSCCSSESKQCEDAANMNNVPHFTFCFSKKDQNKVKTGPAKTSKEIVGTEKKSSKSNREDALPWPGITINPFPNVQTAEEVSKKFFPKTNEQKQAAPNHRRTEQAKLTNTGQKSRAHDKRMIAEVLCSSTDSGCSSQAAQSHDISSAATDSGESESHSSGKQDPQQFRKLQQKWEKLAHGVATSGRKTAEQPQQAVVKKVEKAQVRPNVRDIAVQNNVKKGGAVSKTTGGRLGTRDQAETMAQEKKHHQHSADSSVTPRHHNTQKPEKEKRSKSQIPLLRAAKNAPLKSRIPIQKSGGRAHSTNREQFRNC